MDRYFLDTSFIIAFADREDDHHREAREQMEKMLDGRVYLSEYVFMETVNTVFSRSGGRKSSNLAEYLLKSELDLVNVSKPVFIDAFELFQEEEISFTDCSIVAAMRSLGIEKLASFDEDFRSFQDLEMVCV